MPLRTSKSAPQLLSGLVAAGFFSLLLGMILSGAGGHFFWGAIVAASGGLMLLLVVALRFRHKMYVVEVRRTGAEQLGQA
ncbi:MAG: hypothetical protein QOJ76_1735, partial [Acidobacteriota bacterium]|nr:hypothetical protein [Acidobacteriota bacterium]